MHRWKTEVRPNMMMIMMITITYKSPLEKLESHKFYFLPFVVVSGFDNCSEEGVRLHVRAQKFKRMSRTR